MKKLVILSLTFLLCFNCSDDDDVVVYQLNDFEKSIIPFDEMTEMQFVNQDLETFTATNTQRLEGIVTSTSYDSNVSKSESVSNEINFIDLELNLFNLVRKSSDITVFSITNLEVVGEAFPNSCFLVDNTNDINLEDALTDITIQGFEYNSVFSFENCDYFEGIDNPVTSIIYSVERGIEFIEFLDGTYLRQI